MFSSLRREEMSLVDGVHDIWHIFLITHLQLDNFYLWVSLIFSPKHCKEKTSWNVKSPCESDATLTPSAWLWGLFVFFTLDLQYIT